MLVLLVFASTLVVTMPAAVAGRLVALPPQVESLSGSVNAGQAALRGGHVLSWSLSWSRIALGEIGFSLHLQGGDTLLDGAGGVTPRGWHLTRLEGRAGPGLLALADGLALSDCTARAAVDIARLGQNRRQVTADGRVGIEAGSCLDPAGNEIAIPAMDLTLTTEGTDAAALLTDAAGVELARARVTADRRLILRIEPAGARLVPGMPASSATEIEYPF